MVNLTNNQKRIQEWFSFSPGHRSPEGVELGCNEGWPEGTELGSADGRVDGIALGIVEG